MPRILELKEIDGHLWAKLPTPVEMPSSVHLWTEDETKQAKISAIHDFCFALANQYIEDPTNRLIPNAQPE